MKIKLFVIITLVTIIGAVALNTFFLNKEIEELSKLISAFNIKGMAISDCEKEAKSIYEKFKKSETYISMTVSHDDLTNIEDSFAELIGYISVGDKDGAEVTKNRLINSLEHLKRLSGINVDSVI